MKKLLLILLLICILPARAQYRGAKPVLGEQIDKSHPLARSLVGYWLLNEGAGDTVCDVSGNGGVGTFLDAPTWIAGPRGPAIDFDGSNDGISVSNARAQFTGDVATYSVWFQWDGSSQWNMLFGTGTFPYEDGYGILVSSSTGEIRFYIDGVYTLPNGSITVSVDGEWHNITCVYYGKQYLYYDGVMANNPLAQSKSGSTTNSLYIGSKGAGANFPNHLAIDSAAVWSRALTASEIASIYTDPFQLFERPTPELWVSAGAAPPAGNGQVMIIIMSSLPIWLVAGLAMAMGYNVNVKRKAG